MQSARAIYEPSGTTLSKTQIYRDAFTSVEDIVETVRRWGIIVFPGYVKGEQLSALNTEFDALIANRAELGFPVDEYGNIKNIRVQRDASEPHPCPKTVDFF